MKQMKGILQLSTSSVISSLFSFSITRKCTLLNLCFDLALHPVVIQCYFKTDLHYSWNVLQTAFSNSRAQNNLQTNNSNICILHTCIQKSLQIANYSCEIQWKTQVTEYVMTNDSYSNGTIIV